MLRPFGPCQLVRSLLLGEEADATTSKLHRLAATRSPRPEGKNAGGGASAAVSTGCLEPHPARIPAARTHPAWQGLLLIQCQALETEAVIETLV